ncbi:hypothetical protein ACFOWX_00470 [Sphingorhabdus arenilitoris]|uniref:Secreted protein n=1 Tax=Sphingorhabdus arenilitoris TaxID=1490041 RepID=A0ABV8RD80_9SPHN
MRPMLPLAALFLLPALAACSSEKAEKPSEDNAVTQTRMDDIDKIEGTISDEMIDTSEDSEEAPLAGKEDEAGADSGDGESVPADEEATGDAAE